MYGMSLFCQNVETTLSWNEVVSSEVVKVKDNRTKSKPPPDGFGPLFIPFSEFKVHLNNVEQD